MSLLVISICLCGGSQAASQLTQLIVLGDSLSDNSRLFALTQGRLPPADLYTSPVHSFSDRDVWHGVAAQIMNVTSMAVGGATGAYARFEF